MKYLKGSCGAVILFANQVKAPFAMGAIQGEMGARRSSSMHEQFRGREHSNFEKHRGMQQERPRGYKTQVTEYKTSSGRIKTRTRNVEKRTSGIFDKGKRFLSRAYDKARGFVAGQSVLSKRTVYKDGTVKRFDPSTGKTVTSHLKSPIKVENVQRATHHQEPLPLPRPSRMGHSQFEQFHERPMRHSGRDLHQTHSSGRPTRGNHPGDDGHHFVITPKKGQPSSFGMHINEHGQVSIFDLNHQHQQSHLTHTNQHLTTAQIHPQPINVLPPPHSIQQPIVQPVHQQRPQPKLYSHHQYSRHPVTGQAIIHKTVLTNQHGQIVHTQQHLPMQQSPRQLVVGHEQAPPIPSRVPLNHPGNHQPVLVHPMNGLNHHDMIPVDPRTMQPIQHPSHQVGPHTRLGMQLDQMGRQLDQMGHELDHMDPYKDHIPTPPQIPQNYHHTNPFMQDLAIQGSQQQHGFQQHSFEQQHSFQQSHNVQQPHPQLNYGNAHVIDAQHGQQVILADPHPDAPIYVIDQHGNHLPHTVSLHPQNPNVLIVDPHHGPPPVVVQPNSQHPMINQANFQQHTMNNQAQSQHSMSHQAQSQHSMSHQAQSQHSMSHQAQSHHSSMNNLQIVQKRHVQPGEDIQLKINNPNKPHTMQQTHRPSSFHQQEPLYANPNQFNPSRQHQQLRHPSRLQEARSRDQHQINRLNHQSQAENGQKIVKQKKKRKMTKTQKIIAGIVGVGAGLGLIKAYKTWKDKKAQADNDTETIDQDTWGQDAKVQKDNDDEFEENTEEEQKPKDKGNQQSNQEGKQQSNQDEFDDFGDDSNFRLLQGTPQNLKQLPWYSNPSSLFSWKNFNLDSLS